MNASPPPTTRAFRLPGLRWWIVGLVFLATVINILDRLSVSVLAPVIREQLHLSNLDYAAVGTWFLLAYTISQGFSGWMHDRVGVRRGFAASVVVWSTAALGHAFARGFGSLCCFARGCWGWAKAATGPAASRSSPIGSPTGNALSRWASSTPDRPWARSWLRP